VRTFAQLVTVALLQRWPLDDGIWAESAAAANAAADAAAAECPAAPPADGLPPAWVDVPGSTAVDGGGPGAPSPAGAAAAAALRPPLLAAGALDAQLLRHLFRFYDSNVDLLRLRRGMGDAILAWRPEGLAGPRRVFSGGARARCKPLPARPLAP